MLRGILLFGYPGSGKGTQGKILAALPGFHHVAMGDILRSLVPENPLYDRAMSYVRRGDLVPDEVICRVVVARVDSSEARDGFLLDGFPRTVPQADELGTALDKLGRHLTAVLLIDAPDDAVIQRLSGRRVCKDKGHVYHVDFDPPKNEGFCDQDGSPLIQRHDDEEATVKHRLEVYHEQTKPLVEYYEKHGLLRRFDGTRAPDEVNGHIRATLATLRLEEEL